MDPACAVGDVSFSIESLGSCVDELGVNGFAKVGNALFFGVTQTNTISVLLESPSGEGYLRGDANGDGTVSALVDAGHKTFGIVSGPVDSPVSTERTTGAMRKLRELGIDNVKIVTGDYGYESGRACFTEIAKRMGFEGFEFESAKEVFNELCRLSPIYHGLDWDRIEDDSPLDRVAVELAPRCPRRHARGHRR